MTFVFKADCAVCRVKDLSLWSSVLELLCIYVIPVIGFKSQCEQ